MSQPSHSQLNELYAQIGDAEAETRKVRRELADVRQLHRLRSEEVKILRLSASNKALDALDLLRATLHDETTHPNRSQHDRH